MVLKGEMESLLHLTETTKYQGDCCASSVIRLPLLILDKPF